MPPTISLLKGFEEGILNANGGGLTSLIDGTGMSISNASPRTGNYCLKGLGTSGETDVNYDFSGNPTHFVASFYFKWHTLPNVEISIARVYIPSGSTARINFDPADQKIFGRYVSNGPKVNQVLAADTWYRIDVHGDVSANPSKLWYNVENVGEQYTEYAQAASYFQTILLGFIESTPTINTGAAYWDDLLVSYTAGDYPIGPHAVCVIKPDAEGTHNNTTNCLEDEAGNDINGTTYTAFDKINSLPPDTTHYLRVGTPSAGKYAEVTLSNMPSGMTPVGVRGYIAYTSATTTANNGAVVLMDGVTEKEIWGFTGTYRDFSDGSLTNLYYKSAMITMATLNEANVNALKARFISGNDATPDPYLIDLWVEVAYLTGINITVQANPGSAAAVGISAGVTAGMSIQASVGVVIANGVNANIYVSGPAITINVSVGSAGACGVSQGISKGITTTANPGSSRAAGVNETINVSIIINSNPGCAVSGGISSNISSGILVNTSPGASRAAGISSGISTGVQVTANPGSAAAGGINAVITVSGGVVNITILSNPGTARVQGPGNEVASGVVVGANVGCAAVRGVSSGISAGVQIVANPITSGATGINATISVSGGVVDITIQANPGSARAIGPSEIIASGVTVSSNVGCMGVRGVSSADSISYAVACGAGYGRPNGVGSQIAAGVGIATIPGIAEVSGIGVMFEGGYMIGLAYAHDTVWMKAKASDQAYMKAISKDQKHGE